MSRLWPGAPRGADPRGELAAGGSHVSPALHALVQPELLAASGHVPQQTEEARKVFCLQAKHRRLHRSLYRQYGQ